MVEFTARAALESMMRATEDDATPIIRRLARIQARTILDAPPTEATEARARLLAEIEAKDSAMPKRHRSLVDAEDVTITVNRQTLEKLLAAPTEANSPHDGLREAFKQQTDLVERLCDTVDREADDIGGEGSLTIIRLLGTQYTDARAALGKE